MDSRVISQIFAPAPEFSDDDIPDLRERVCLVTGGNDGIGKEVVRILYSQNATVYVAARSEEKTIAAFEAIREAVTWSIGRLEFIPLDLADLSTIKTTVKTFLAKELRLDLLFNNAGVMASEPRSKTAQGYDLELGVNALGAFLLTKLLTPTLIGTVQMAWPNSVRVIWVSSVMAEVFSPIGGVEMDNLEYRDVREAVTRYAISKAGVYYYGTEMTRRFREEGVISIPLNPGNLRPDLWNGGSVPCHLLRKFVSYPVTYGAATELYAAFSPHITTINPTAWVIPWGRLAAIRKDLRKGAAPEFEGGTGIAEKFWEWSEDQVKPYT